MHRIFAPVSYNAIVLGARIYDAQDIAPVMYLEQVTWEQIALTKRFLESFFLEVVDDQLAVSSFVLEGFLAFALSLVFFLALDA